MLTVLFVILMLAVFGKLIGFALKATWSITKVVFTLVFLPLTLIVMVVGGLIYVAIGALIVIGIVSLVKNT